MTAIIKPDQLPDDLLDYEIPCKGIIYRPVARSCSRAATLRTYGHGCLTSFKCLECWQLWYAAIFSAWQRDKRRLHCKKCNKNFPTVEAFSDYRPF